MDEQIVIPKQTRGRPRKYHFDDMKINDIQSFSASDTSVGTLHTAAKNWVKTEGLTWRFKCWTVKNKIHLARVK